MKLLILVTVLLAALSGSKVEKHDISNIFDARNVQIRDQVAGQIIQELDLNLDGDKSYYAIVRFDGQITIDGELEFYEANDAIEGWGLLNFFTPDDISKHKVPILNIDKRYGFTLVDNASEDLVKLRKNGKKYNVKMTIKDFEIYSQGKAQENKATLVEIINVEKIE